MSIRSKLAWTFILLLIFGITAISSYSIVFIRNYMLEEGKREMERETRWLAVTVENMADDSAFTRHLREAADISGYRLAVYGEDGALLFAWPDSTSPHHPRRLDTGLLASLEARDGIPLLPERPDSEYLVSMVHLDTSANTARYIRASQLKDDLYAPIRTIRWIIYYGMFISIGLVILVSILMARYLTRPITRIKNAAQEIASGDTSRQIDLERGDEFGTLADSLNRMASRLRADTAQIKQFAEKQRQFFGDITHEIRNPLHTITGALEMLEMEDLPEDERRRYLRSARKQTERISRLFKDLLTLQRYDSDEKFIERKTFDLSMIAEHMLEWYGDAAAEKGIDLHVDTHECRAVGDPGKIEQVIDNLVSNAVKYTSEGTITMSYSREDDEVVVEVEDTGIGISEEHLERLFDRFYRTDKARSRDKGGTGLGLAVVKSILGAHGSEIEVESEPGRGTSFWFSLPASG
ncbi:MAG: HAMP domain-containing sensor histidine kinase [Balneolaceae bacterium]|nr:HAMP domain-containing sensor histidine kinase [Balneolaceae bacterium]